jgi:hypothetical protein
LTLKVIGFAPAGVWVCAAAGGTAVAKAATAANATPVCTKALLSTSIVIVPPGFFV